MAAVKKSTKKRSAKKTRRGFLARIRGFFEHLRDKNRTFLLRRPHRSFRVTRRRDYKRSLKLPGYFAFSNEVLRLLWKSKRTFLVLILMFGVLTFLLVGFASQDIISAIRDGLDTTDEMVFLDGFLGDVEKAFVVFASTLSGEVYGVTTDDQKGFQLFSVMLALLIWLTTVWIIRNELAGYKVKARDAVYNAGAPIISTFIIVLVMIVQLIPVAIAVIGYAAATASGILNGGVETMLFWLAVGLLAILSFYWITATFIALVVVTLPGMYPFRALKIAGDMVVGRRIRILLRIVWMILGIGLFWVVIMIPVILFDGWIKSLLPSIEWLPIIPVMLVVMISTTLIWASSYVYMLYRKVVEDDALPA